MKKRRASGELRSAKKKDNLDARRVEFAQTLRALNSQFCEWVQEQNREKPAELWTEGVEDYLTHAKALLGEFSDVIDEEEEEQQDTDAEKVADAPAAAANANGFGSAFKMPPAAGFGGGGAASQPAGSRKELQQSSVADFLKIVPAPASAAPLGFGAFGGGSAGASGSGGKLPPMPAFGGGGGKDAAAAVNTGFSGSGGSAGFGGGSTGFGGGSTTASLGAALPAFNFSNAVGVGSESTPAAGARSSPAATSQPAFGSSGGAGDQGSGRKFGTTGSSGFFGSKSPAFGGAGSGGFGSGGFNSGVPASGASSAAADSSAAASPPAAGSNPPAASGGLFASPPTQPLPSVFSFASGNAGTSGASGGFNFGGAAASAPAQNGEAAEAAGDADAPDENPEDKVKVQLDETGTNILFRDNAKLYFQDKASKKWEDRGRGNLTLRRAEQQPGDSGPNTPFLVFTMESGKVLLNASLYKGLSMQQQKAMVLMTLEVADAPGGSEGDAAKSAMTLVNFRLRSAEEGKNFHDTIKEHVPT